MSDVLQRTHESISPGNLVILIQRTISQLDIKLPVSCRLAMLLKLCEEARNFSEVQNRMQRDRKWPRHDDIAVMWVQAELNEYACIAAYPPERGVEQWKAKYIEAACGHTLPTNDKNNLSRSTQSELLIFSILMRAGADPRIEEPDMSFDIGHESRVAFAVKRVRSRAKLVENYKAATKQLRNSSLLGLVFLDCVFEPVLRIDEKNHGRNDLEISIRANAEVVGLADELLGNLDSNYAPKEHAASACIVFRQSYWINQAIGRAVVANHLHYRRILLIDDEIESQIQNRIQFVRMMTPEMFAALPG